MTYNTAAIRKFLTKQFSAEELMALFFDYFPAVYDDVTLGMTKSRQIQHLIAYGRRNGRMEDLLAALERERPHLYQRDQFTDQRKPAPLPAHQPAQRNPRQIFLSHAHQDADFAHRLAGDLKAHGYDIWMAPDSIQPGEKWVDAINRGLDESGIFVLILTPEAVNSHWVQDETSVAIQMKNTGEIKFLPLQVKACQLPAIWRAYQWVPFRAGYDDGFQQLLNWLNRNIQKENASRKLQQTRIEVIELEQLQMDKLLADRIIWPKDGKEMVLVPAGEFLYGGKKKKLFLPSFYIGKTAVTNAEYKLFLDANPDFQVPFLKIGRFESYSWDRQKRRYPKGKGDHPVILVSWYDAQAFAQWVGKQLPTEKQWEKAARSTDDRLYPWGDSWQINHCNTREAGIWGSLPVGHFSQRGDSLYGCVDMSGNVWEWTVDWYDADETIRVVRGGSWFDYHDGARVTSRGRLNPTLNDLDIGFRLVSPIGSGS